MKFQLAFFWPLIFIVISLGFSFYSFADFYKNFADLSAHEVEGLDYRISTINRASPFLVMAIHGGRIEARTSELARQIAADSMNLYLFEGIKASDNSKLHITSANFDEPSALSLVDEATDCFSVHGYKDDQSSGICVGGLAKEHAQFLAQSLTAALAKFQPSVEIIFPCKQFLGEEINNIANRCKNSGVQIELSSKLRKELLEDPNFLKQVASAIRNGWITSCPTKSLTN